MAYFLSIFNSLLLRERLSNTFPVCAAAAKDINIHKKRKGIFFIQHFYFKYKTKKGNSFQVLPFTRIVKYSNQ